MYRIVSLQAENVKKLKAVSITPDGNVITLTGENGAGKSSVLDCIAMTLGGEKLVPERPIRQGQKSAKVTVNLGDLVVTRRFTAGGSEVTVQNAKGETQLGPQGILNKLVGKLAFDPLEFATMEAKPQLDTLCKLVGIDLAPIYKKRNALFDERTNVNRDAAAAKVKMNATPRTEDAPEAEVSAAELSAELERINAHNQGIERKQSDLNAFKSDFEEAKANSATKEEELKAAKLAYQAALDEEEACQSSYNKFKAEVEKLVKQDPEPVRAQIATADETNRKVRQNVRHKELSDEFEKLEKSSKSLTAAIEKIDADKEDKLAKAKFPLKELSFDENGVLFNGNPFSQASDAEKLRTSVAIGMAMNPTLRVMFVRNGSLLDKKGLRIVAELAESKDFQIWIEDARSTDPAAITIEDGEIQE
jgi:energy-coupling factor transporter ATP-binding protein EcfA2